MTAPTVTPAPPPPRSSSPVGPVIMVVLGAVIGLMALGPLAGGSFLLWAHATQRDDDGFYATREERLETTTYAITSEDIELDPTDDDTVWDFGDLVTLRVDVTSVREAPVFVGVGPADEVREYFRGVGRAEVDDLRFDPFEVDYRYRDGGPPPQRPAEADFWAVSVQGSGPQVLEWEPQSGEWIVVIMNADGEAGVAVDTALAAKSPWVFRVAVGLLIGGFVGLAVAAVLLVVGIVLLARGSHLEMAPPAPATPTGVTLEGRLDDRLNRGLWLVKWFLLIPHFIVLAVLWAVFWLLTVLAFFAILITGRYPRPLFDFNAGVLRWSWRVWFYGYGALGTDRYPPFTLGAAPDYPARLEVAYPERLSRGLVLVKWWLLVIPHALVVTVFLGGAWGVGDDVAGGAPGLIPLLVIFAGVVLLFRGHYPRGIFDLVMGLQRWVYRVLVYAALLRDDYPPFRLDQGGHEEGGHEEEVTT